MIRRLLLGAFLAGCQGSPTSPPPLLIASSANFSRTAGVLAKAFTQETGIPATVVSSSTGKLYSQIEAGAPFDVFFAADTLRPALLARNGTALPGSRWTYARGVVVVWTPGSGSGGERAAGAVVAEPGDGGAGEPGAAESGAAEKAVLADPTNRVALANPKLAPYGVAAAAILDALSSPASRVQGENVLQAYQFAVSGNAQAAVVSLSMVDRAPVWIVPDSLYPEVLQGAVVLRDTDATRSFKRFALSQQAATIITDAGYALPVGAQGR
ncbi:MAG: molybdate transport system substrate-binding protein [Rhodothermales bacterium]|jgi:molybdate transport system substrate-binding protein